MTVLVAAVAARQFQTVMLWGAQVASDSMAGGGTQIQCITTLLAAAAAEWGPLEPTDFPVLTRLILTVRRATAATGRKILFLGRRYGIAAAAAVILTPVRGPVDQDRMAPEVEERLREILLPDKTAL
jgi:hypothetical protein